MPFAEKVVIAIFATVIASMVFAVVAVARSTEESLEIISLKETLEAREQVIEARDRSITILTDSYFIVKEACQ